MKRAATPDMHELCLMFTRSDRALRSVIAAKLEPQRLTMMEWLVLGTVATGPRKGLSMTQIAADLDVTLPQVTALMSTLAQAKLIKQTTATHDHRSRFVTMTLRGKRILAKLESTVATAVRDLTEDLPHDNWEAYLKALEHISKTTS